MRVKYNEELAKAVLKGKIRGGFYWRNSLKQVFLTIVTHRGEDLVCFANTPVDCQGHVTIKFRTLTPEEEKGMDIGLFDLEIGDIIACDVVDKEEALIGVLSGMHDNIIEVSCWARIDSNRLEKGSDKFCYIKDCRCPSKETRDKFLKLLDEKGYYLKDGKLYEKRKNFYPFQKVIVKSGSSYRADFFSHMVGSHYVTTYGYAFLEEEIIPYNEETKHLIGTKCD